MKGRIFSYATGILVMLQSACHEANVNPDVNIIGKPYDQALIGKWATSYSRRDMYNAITFMSDTLIFGYENAGTMRRYEFGQLSSEKPFRFYSSQDTLHMYINRSWLSRKYLVKKDSLLLTSFVPDSLSYLEEKHFTIRYAKNEN